MHGVLIRYISARNVVSNQISQQIAAAAKRRVLLQNVLFQGALDVALSQCSECLSAHHLLIASQDRRPRDQTASGTVLRNVQEILRHMALNHLSHATHVS